MRTASPSTSGETEAWSCEPGTENPLSTGLRRSRQEGPSQRRSQTREAQVGERL